MSCSRYRDTVVLFADGELTGDAASDVRVHVGGCASCRETLGELERLKEALTPKTSGNPTMAETRFWRSFEADLALRVHRESTPFWRRAIVLPVPAAVCMGLAVVALTVMVLDQRSELHSVRGEVRKMQAHLEADQESVVFATSPHQMESVSLLNAAGKNRFPDVRRMSAPAPSAMKARVPTKDSRDAFKVPAPYATPDVPPGMELRFVDSSSSDFY